MILNFFLFEITSFNYHDSIVRKTAIVKLSGGLGNQLFQYSFAKELHTKGFNVFIDTSFFEKPIKNELIDYRILEIPPIELGFKKYNLIQKMLIDSYNNLNFIPKKLIPINSVTERNILNNKFKSLNYFTGFWQDIEVIYRQKMFLLNYFEKISGKSLQTKKNYHKTLFHIRRGDYINIGENLSINFYKKALSYCKENIRNFKYDVFTDDIDWVKKESIFNEADNLFSADKAYNNTLETFINMIGYGNYVVGNSTFSLIPAILSEDETTKIVIAEPWFRNKTKDLNFGSKYIKIKNV